MRPAAAGDEWFLRLLPSYRRVATAERTDELQRADLAISAFEMTPRERHQWARDLPVDRPDAEQHEAEEARMAAACMEGAELPLTCAAAPREWAARNIGRLRTPSGGRARSV